MMHLLRDLFYRRLAITLLLSFVAVAALFVVVLLSVADTSQREITQRLHRELAQHVVDEHSFFHNGRPDVIAAKHAFHHLMVLGPAFEFYLLDTQGNILAYSADPGKVKLTSVNLQPIQAFLQGQKEQPLPLYGQDPRASERHKVFSAAPVYENGDLQGYLYVIIAGELLDAVSASVQQDQHLVTAVITVVAGILFSLVATLTIIGLLTSPLRRLARDVSVFHEKGLDDASLPLHSWQANAKSDIERLGYAFHQMAKSLREQYAKVKSVDDLRKELMAHVSHDLRTPLASLCGYLETWLLKREQLTPEESQQYIETAHNSAKKVNVLVDQLFELAHLDGDNVTVMYEEVAIAELVQDVLQKFQLEASSRGVTLDVEPKDPSLVVRGDIEKLERVFTNLIENAIRHCQQGDNVLVKLTLQQAQVSVQVIDSGIGIPPSDLPHIFDAHYKAANSVRDSSAHGGLGLAIVKRLLDLHETRIRVESKEQAGTRFSFDLSIV